MTLQQNRFAVLCSFLLMFSGVGTTLSFAAQTDSPDSGILSIFFTNGFGGRLETNAFHLGLDAFEMPILERRAHIGPEKMITIDLGNSVAPFYLSRMDEGQSMREALTELGYDAMVPGNYEFEYGTFFFQTAPVQIEDAAISSDEGSATPGKNRVPIICANLLQHNGHPFLTPYLLLERSGLKIAILGIMDVEMRKQILDEHFVIPRDLTDLRLVEPLPVLKDLVPTVRSAADLVVLISNFPYEKNLEIAHQISGIDLIISGQGERFRDQYTEVTGPDRMNGNASRTLVVTAGAYLGQLNIGRATQSFSVLNFQRISVDRKGPPGPLLMQKIEQLESRFKNYCLARYQRDADAVLSPLPPEISQEDFARFVLFAMLFRTHSELGLIHHEHFDFSQWKQIIADRNLTIRECFLLMPENHALLTVRLRGNILNQLARQSQAEKTANRNYLHFLSIKPVQNSDIRWFVHRLPIRDQELYASCSINVLVNGGSIYQGLTKGSHIKTKFKMTSYLRFSPDGETKIIRDILIDFLRQRPSDHPLETGNQLAELPYLQRPLWKLQIQETGVSFNLNRDRNSDIYPNVTIPELQKAEITSLRLQGKTKVARETATLLWENLLQTDLGQIKVGSESFQENKDDLVASTDLILKFLNLTGTQPFTGLRFDTEFTTEAGGIPQRDLIVKVGMMLPNVWRFSSSRLNYSRIIDLNTGNTKRKGLNAFNFDTQLIIPAGQLRWRNTFRGTYFLPDTTVSSERRQLLINARSALKIPVVENISFAPVFEAIFFKGIDASTVAQEYLLSVQLAYSKDWKWQYMRYFLREQKE